MQGAGPKQDKRGIPAEGWLGSMSQPKQAEWMAQCRLLDPRWVQDWELGGSPAWGFRARMGPGDCSYKGIASCVGCLSPGRVKRASLQRGNSL